jgi:hypothetical protein
MIIKTNKVRRYKAGYEIRYEDWQRTKSDEPTAMVAAYTPKGDYIGDSKFAKRLVTGRGIHPEKSNPDHSVCSIGYSVKDGKWYGWSHRAIFGFEVGSTCKRGDCNYRPKNKTDLLKGIVEFWSSEDRINVKGKHTKEGVAVSWTYSNDIPNESLRSQIGGCTEEYPDSYGKGEWTAKTTEDARKMAIDFSEGVS